MTVKNLGSSSARTAVQEPEIERSPKGSAKVADRETRRCVSWPEVPQGRVTSCASEYNRQCWIWDQLKAQMAQAEQSLKAHHESLQLLLEQQIGSPPPSQSCSVLGRRKPSIGQTIGVEKEPIASMWARSTTAEAQCAPDVPFPLGRPDASAPELELEGEGEGPELPLPGQPEAPPAGGPPRPAAARARHPMGGEAGHAKRRRWRYGEGPPEMRSTHFDARTQKLVLLPIWANRRERVKLTRMRMSGLEGEVVQPLPNFEEQEANTFRSTGWMRHVIQHPMSYMRMSWDIFSLFLVLYDIVMIPMGFFSLSENDPFLEACQWVTRLFWTLDIPLSFISGYVGSDGCIEMRPRRICARYLRTWFILDVLVVGVDWTEHLMRNMDSQGMSVADVGKASRPFRIIRMVRLLRLARMNEVVHVLMERLSSDVLVVCGSILKLIFAMLFLGHVVGCLWWAVGEASPESQSWILSAGWESRALGEQYIMSYRWALSQFAGGMDEVVPHSFGEHLFATGVFVIAFWSGTVFLSILTSHMTQLFIMGSQQTQQLSLLRRYLSQHGVSRGLAMRAQRNAQHVMNAQQRAMSEQAVGLMDLVSQALRIELHYEMYSPVLSMNPFFNDYMQVCPHVVRKICHAALSMSANSQGDIIFHCGESASGMIVVKSGVLRYSWGVAKEPQIEDVKEHGYLSEAALWVRWSHRGVLTVAEDSVLILVDAESFQSIVGNFDMMTYDPSEYASWYVEKLNECQDDVTDLPHPSTEELPVRLHRTSKGLSLTMASKRKLSTVTELRPSQEGQVGTPLSRADTGFATLAGKTPKTSIASAQQVSPLKERQVNSRAMDRVMLRFQEGPVNNTSVNPVMLGFQHMSEEDFARRFCRNGHIQIQDVDETEV